MEQNFQCLLCEMWKGTFHILTSKFSLKMVMNLKSEDSHKHEHIRSFALCRHSLTVQ
jgi:hypothetical protein